MSDLLHASRVVATLAALVAGCATWRETGSLYRSRCDHFGVRPAVSYPDGYGASAQWTTDRRIVLGPGCP